MAKNRTTPTSTHHQKFLWLFPNWRLANGIKKASDDELAASAEACEWWAWRGAIVLMVGLIAEIILAVWDAPHESISGRWGTVGATVLVALGVWTEVQFAKIGSRSTEERTLRAHSRLATTTAELVKLKQFRALSADQMSAVAAAMRPFVPMDFSLSVSFDAPEQHHIAHHLGMTLRMAGWNWVDWSGSGNIGAAQLNDGVDVRIGLQNGVVAGMGIVISPPTNDQYKLTRALVTALLNVGLEACTREAIAGNGVKIMIAAKA
jgi:hypothetical protein